MSIVLQERQPRDFSLEETNTPRSSQEQNFNYSSPTSVESYANNNKEMLNHLDASRPPSSPYKKNSAVDPLHIENYPASSTLSVPQAASKHDPQHIQQQFKKFQISSSEDEEQDLQRSTLDTSSIIERGSYIQDANDDKVLLNKTTARRKPQPPSRRATQDSIRQMPFHSDKHAQIIPMSDQNTENATHTATADASASSVRSFTGSVTRPNNVVQDGSLKRSESATAEIRKMRASLLQKREMRKKQRNFLDDDRVLVGNKVSEGHVNFTIAYNMLTGIRVAVSRCSGIMKPLTPQDFKFTKKLAFDFHGNELTPSSQYAFKFKDYCPEVFRELRALFGLDPADYLMSLTSKYILSELNSPGKSGSFFYFSRDYKYIIKTIHHSEHRHLRKTLKDYYTHIKENPDTLISQFYGLHRVKMPISFRNKVKHRKIYFLVMNNLFPPHLEMHTTFDLKGSTWGRFTKVTKDKEPKDQNHFPVLKDLNWLEQERSIEFGPLKKKKFLVQLKKDVELLSRLNIMDYSLLLGIHDMERGNDLIDEHNKLSVYSPSSPNPREIKRESIKQEQEQQSSSVVQHFFQQDEGGIRASDQFNNDLNKIYYIGIIDCLTNYSMIKKLETFWRGLSHDLKVVSAIPPRDYGDRFYDFIEDSVNKVPKKRYKDNPKSAPYRD